jgi:hypothetical protein
MSHRPSARKKHARTNAPIAQRVVFASSLARNDASSSEMNRWYLRELCEPPTPNRDRGWIAAADMTSAAPLTSVARPPLFVRARMTCDDTTRVASQISSSVAVPAARPGSRKKGHHSSR